MITRDEVARLFGCRLTLISDSGWEQFLLYESGFVAASLGTKHGPRFAPGLTWSLTKDGRLLMYDHKRFLWVLWWVRDRIYAEWSSIRFDGATIRAETTFGPKSYEIEKLADSVA